MHHLLMQCPHFHDRGEKMLEDIYRKVPEVEATFKNDPPKVFAWLLVKEFEECHQAVMYEVWRISGQTINKIYNEVVRSRQGVG